MNSSIKTWTSYYARPSSYIHGGVNESRLQWCLALSKNYDCYVANAKNGYSGERNPNLKYIDIKHIFKRRFSMIPVDFRRINFGENAVVQMHEGWTFSALAMSIACILTRTRYIVTPHGVYDPGVVKNLKQIFFRKSIEKFVLEHAQFVHLFFDSEKSGVYEISKDAKVLVATTGIDDFITDAKWKGGGKYALFFGRIDIQHKGLDLLLDAFKVSQSSLQLLIVGSGSLNEEKRLSEKINSLGLREKVYTISYQPRGILESLIVNSAFVIHPSRWEAFGRGIMESVATGAPTIVSSDAQVSKSNFLEGLIYNVPPNSTSLINAINYLVEAQHDPNMQKEKFNELASGSGSWEISLRKLMEML